MQLGSWAGGFRTVGSRASHREGHCHCLSPSALLSSVLVVMVVTVATVVSKDSIDQFRNPKVRHLFLYSSNNIRTGFHQSCVGHVSISEPVTAPVTFWAQT